ncbi:MAG TPA: hypothetical protein VEV38_06635 [Candidatus Eremiobacteraceae bacterium]|nr:hypothetical protein [Candidatus Eremiobacteraceae bacterium]
MGFGDNDLAAISGTSATDLWAVGWFKHDGIDQTLIEHFDGNNWTIVPSPNNPKYPVDALYSVSADSSSDAWAVGRMRGNCNCDDSVRPLALHWNGSAWSEVPMPPVREESSESFVIGVSIDPTDPSDVWAVGYVPSLGIRGSQSDIFAEHWNGRKWEIIGVPRRKFFPTMFGVTTAPGGSAWAVGIDFGYGTRYSIMSWNGSSWSTQASVNAHDRFNAVSAFAPNDVWAAGYLIEHFDGTKWSVALDPRKTGDAMNAVSAIAPNDVWAAGDHGILISWDGTAWIHWPTLLSASLTGIQALPGGAIAVGTLNDKGRLRSVSTLTSCTSDRLGIQR